MGPKVFLSYRRGDSADVTGRIDDHIVKIFGRDNISKMWISIPLGSDFRRVLAEAVGQCDVLFGHHWA